MMYWQMNDPYEVILILIFLKLHLHFYYGYSKMYYAGLEHKLYHFFSLL